VPTPATRSACTAPGTCASVACSLQRGSVLRRVVASRPLPGNDALTARVQTWQRPAAAVVHSWCSQCQLLLVAPLVASDHAGGGINPQACLLGYAAQGAYEPISCLQGIRNMGYVHVSLWPGGVVAAGSMYQPVALECFSSRRWRLHCAQWLALSPY
jgi:hypothetical protein